MLDSEPMLETPISHKHAGQPILPPMPPSGSRERCAWWLLLVLAVSDRGGHRLLGY